MEKWYLLVLLIRISLVWNDLEHLFLRLLVKIVKFLISQIVGPVRQLCKYKGKEWGKVCREDFIPQILTVPLPIIKVLWPYRVIQGTFSAKTCSCSLSRLKILSAPRWGSKRETQKLRIWVGPFHDGSGLVSWPGLWRTKKIWKSRDRDGVL